jgi:hypothetical protein
MKARVIETNEIVELQEDMNSDYFTKDGVQFRGFELDFNVEQPDYWEKLKHQYAGMAMQAMISNSHNTDYHKDWSDGYGKWRKYNNKELAEMAVYYATALVEKLKEESKCEK